MKYVRTTDGRIIKIPNKHKETVYDGNVIISLEKIINGVRGREIVFGLVDKKADTIEELCDVIVCGEKLFYPLTSNREGNEFDREEINRFRESVAMNAEEYNKIKETTNDFEPYFWKVYGAIWTDKGLQFVAKMNDKGELELL